MQEKIYNLTLETLEHENYFRDVLVEDRTNNYYWSDAWDAELYIKLAQLGFISTSYETKEGLVMLPELQVEYSILDFKNLHISQKVKKLLNKNSYELSFNTHFETIIEEIAKQHKHNWFKDEYVELMQELYSKNWDNFKLVSVALLTRETNSLVAGEIGYIIGKTYTSLTGFSSREKVHNNCGTLQLVVLAHYLEKNDFSFWSLGHPHMEYKKKLGAKTYSREEFLQRWQESVRCV